MRKVYRIECVDRPPVYRSSKKAVYSWMTRNPGELQSWTVVDALEELDDLASRLDGYERELDRLRSELNLLKENS